MPHAFLVCIFHFADFVHFTVLVAFEQNKRNKNKINSVCVPREFSLV